MTFELSCVLQRKEAQEFLSYLYMLPSNDNLVASWICFVIYLQPLHRELYTIHPTTFFVPSFIKAIGDNTEESLRSIMSEPSPGVFTFEMLQPHFCELLLSEVIIFYCICHVPSQSTTYLI